MGNALKTGSNKRKNATAQKANPVDKRKPLIDGEIFKKIIAKISPEELRRRKDMFIVKLDGDGLVADRNKISLNDEIDGLRKKITWTRKDGYIVEENKRREDGDPLKKIGVLKKEKPRKATEDEIDEFRNRIRGEFEHKTEVRQFVNENPQVLND